MEPRSISPIFLRGKDPFPAQRGVLFPAQQPRSVSPLAQQYAASVHYKLLAGLRPRPRPAPPPQQAPSWLPPGASLSKAAAAHRAHRASSAPYQRKPPQQQSSSVSPGRSVSPGTSSGHKPGAGPRSSSLSPPGGHPATLQTPWGLYHSHVLAAASSAATPGLWNPARSSILPAPAAASRSAAAVGGPSRPPFASLTPYATTGRHRCRRTCTNCKPSGPPSATLPGRPRGRSRRPHRSLAPCCRAEPHIQHQTLRAAGQPTD